MEPHEQIVADRLEDPRNMYYCMNRDWHMVCWSSDTQSGSLLQLNDGSLMQTIVSGLPKDCRDNFISRVRIFNWTKSRKARPLDRDSTTG